MAGGAGTPQPLSDVTRITPNRVILQQSPGAFDQFATFGCPSFGLTTVRTLTPLFPIGWAATPPGGGGGLEGVGGRGQGCGVGGLTQMWSQTQQAGSMTARF